MLKRVHHIEIVVPDLDRSVEFYAAMGFEVIRRTDHHGGSVEVQLPGDPVILELHRVDPEENPGVNHIAFEVEDSAGTIAALKDVGFTFELEAGYVEHTNRYVTNFRDPSGFRVQFTE